MEKMPGVIELVRLPNWNLIPSGGRHMLPIQIKGRSPKEICAIGVNMRELKFLQRLKFRMSIVIVLRQKWPHTMAIPPQEIRA